jgi:hypothetical protein
MRTMLRTSAGPLVGWAAILLGLAVAVALPEGRGCERVGETGLVGIVDEIVPMPDGGFVQVGFDHVRDADWELLVIRSNADGSFRWASRCGGFERDLAKSVVARDDGGVLVVGQTKSGIERPVGAREAPFNTWLLSFDGDGRLLWQRTYGGAVHATADVVSQQRGDGGYLLFGHTRSPEDPLKRQRWLLRIGPEGEERWSRILGFGFLAVPRPDGLDVLAGEPIPISLHVSRTPPELEWWLARVSWAGEVDWSWSLRVLPRALNPEVDSLRISSLAPASGGGYLLCGSLRSRGPTTAWIMKVDPDGHLVWRRIFDADVGPYGAVVLPLRDGGAYLVGETGGSFWAARLAAHGAVMWQQTFVRGTPYAATLGRGGNLVIGGITTQRHRRQSLLFVSPEGQASLVTLPNEHAQVWPDYRVPWFPARPWYPEREERFVDQTSGTVPTD